MHPAIRHILPLGLCLFMASAQAAHPLVSEDTGTQDSGGQQIEINSDWQNDAGTSTHLAGLAYTLGLTPALDVFISAPHTLSSPSGANDASVGLKWRFLEAGDWSFGLKPEYLVATGNASQGLGNGRDGMALTLMAQWQQGDWTWLFNAGTTRNQFSDAATAETNREWVQRESVALMYQATESLSLVLDVGQADHRQKAESQRPQYLLLGTILALREGLDIDIGYRLGLNSTETDAQFGLGLTWRFR